MGNPPFAPSKVALCAGAEPIVMRTAILASVAKEMDYVDAFQSLLEVQKRLHKEGPKVAILVEEACAFLNLGDPAQCVSRCEVVLAAHPTQIEVRYLRARAYTLQALVQCGAATAMAIRMTTAARPLLEAAAEDLEVVAEAWPDDEEVLELLVEVDDILMAEDFDEQVQRELGHLPSGNNPN